MSNTKVGRPKKDYISLNVKLDADVAESLNEYCKFTGQTKTLAVERALTAFLKTQNKSAITRLNKMLED